MDATPPTAPTHTPGLTSGPQARSATAARQAGPALRLARAYADPEPAAVDATPARSPDTVSFSFPQPQATSRDPQAPAVMPARARSLIAATVAAPVEPAPGPAGSTPASGLAFYRHPADRNTAATAIAAGRTLDVRG